MLSKSKIFFGANLIVILIIGLRSLNNRAFLVSPRAGGPAYYNGQKFNFKAWVCEEADLNYKSRRLTVCAGSRVLVTTNLYPEYDYGDFLELSGLVQKPEEFKGFDYERYLARYDIYSVMYYPKITQVNGELNFGQKIYGRLLKIKQGIKLTLDRSLPEPEAGLADALLLGYRRTILPEDSDLFARVGLSHLIAISGSHITIMSAMLLNVALFIGLRRRAALKIVFIFLFVYPLITGLSASAVRAAIMGALVFLALYYGRLSLIIRALVFSAALMLLFNPRLLRDDVGFQLSFAAVLGIIYIYPFFSKLAPTIKKKFSGLPGKLLSAFWEIFSLTLACQIAVLPIMISKFKQLSLVSFIANPAIIWIFPFLLAALIMPIIPALIFPSLGPWLFAPAYLMLKFIFVAAHFFAAPSWAAISWD
jgi:competence protein ComEC